MEIVDVTLRESVHTEKNITYEDALEYVSVVANNIEELSYIEIGYLDTTKNNKNLGMYNKEFFIKAKEKVEGKAKISAMLHLREFSPDIWDKEALDCIDMVRILIDDNCSNLENIINFFHDMNIKVSVNCSYISKKTREQFEKIVENIVKANADLIYIADTNGSMTEKALSNYISCMKEKYNINVGIHTHNHMQLAFANTFNMIPYVDFVDASIDGFGKGAGNVKLEALLLLISKTKKKDISREKLYKIYEAIKFFYEEILKDTTLNYIENYSNLLYAYMNLKLAEINEYQKIDRDRRIAKILGINVDLLENAVNYAKSKVLYYKENKGYEDCNEFEKLPILNKEIYRKNVPPFNNNLLAEKINSSFIFSTSGTTGIPQYVIRDVNDINYQINDYKGLDIGSNDVVLNLFWSGIWGIYTTANLTLEKTGATVIPVGGNNLNEEMLKNIENMILNFNVNVLFGVPSTVVSITNYLKNNPNCVKNINKIFCLGEKMYRDTYKYLKQVYGNVEIKTKYGCMESAGIGYQCKNINCNEYHIFKNRYVEILDIDTNKKLENGQKGKIVVTTLNKRLIPLIRYDTGDIGQIEECNCGCGENYILKIDSRIGKEFIIGSVHLATDKIQKIIQNNSQNYCASQIVIEKENQMDKLSILINSTEIDNQAILYELNKEYPDISILINEKKINEIIIKKVSNNELTINNRTGKVYPIIDNRI